jgi:hypothetical protein
MRVVGSVVVAVSIVSVAACGGQSATSATVSSGPLPAGTFVAQYQHGAGDTGGGNGTFLSVFDETSGEHLRDLTHVPDGTPVHLGGYSRSSDGSVVFAVDQGPYYRGHLANGDPKPGSCGATVYQVDATTGRTRSLFTVGADRTANSPVLSPDGKSVAYLSEGCTDSFAEQLVLRDLGTGAERRVAVPNAGGLHVVWRGDGSELVVTFMYAETPAGADSRGYAVVHADATGPIPADAIRHAPDKHCEVEDAAYTSTGLQLVEGCPDVVNGPARLVQLDGDGPAVSWRADTGVCPNGLTLREDLHGKVLVTATTECGGGAAPVDVVQLWTRSEHRELRRYVNPQQFVSGAT